MVLVLIIDIRITQNSMQLKYYMFPGSLLPYLIILMCSMNTVQDMNTF
jgi:hypothetical protein